jgi:alkylation response protein AidB-like acyl-CoA dehydrogenase
MDFAFTEEQMMLLDTTRRFIEREYDFETRRRIAAAEPGISASAWKTLAELGLLALLIPEDDGGLGGGPVETLLVMTALGEGLVVEPYLPSAVLATSAIARLGNDAQRAEWLAPMGSGELIAALAHDEPASGDDPLVLDTRAARVGSGYLLSGRKAVVYGAPHAGLLLVSARLDGEGLALFAVRRDTPGLRLSVYPTFDGHRAADVHLDDVHVPATARLGAEGADVAAALAAVLDLGLAALCAEATGVIDRALATTIEYARTRKQFGQPIGKFQALQHRMADMQIHREQALSMAYLAAVRAADADAHRRATALSAAKVVIGEACRFVGQQAVQIHGGMGVTDELGVSHQFKRLFAIEKLFGSTLTHLERFGRLRNAA